jgi:hypothetical protein
VTSPVATPWDTAPVNEEEDLSNGRPGGKPQFTTENKRPIAINVIEELVNREFIFRFRSLPSITRQLPYAPVPVKRRITKTVNVEWVGQILMEACLRSVPLTVTHHDLLKGKGTV